MTALLAMTLAMFGMAQGGAPTNQQTTKQDEATEAVSPLVGKPAPAFTLKAMDGKLLASKSLKGNVVFIDFWATWCPPCRATLPETDQLHKKYASQGLKVLAISDEDVPTIASYLKKQKFTFPSYRDPKNDVATAFNVEGIPTFVVIGRDGVVIDLIIGSDNEARVARALEKAGIKLSTVKVGQKA